MKKKTVWLTAALFSVALAACDKQLCMECVCDGEDADDVTDDTAADSVDDPIPDTPADSVPDSEDPAPDPEPDTAIDTAPDSEPDTSEDPVEEDPGGPEVPAGCTLPSIPDTGLHVYYCSVMDTTMTMRFYREVDLAAGGTVPYGEELPCRITTPAREMLCEVSGADSWGTGSLVKFTIQTPGVNGGWSCPETNGTPIVKYDGEWVSLNPPITSPACRHNFDLP
jgi:hypothetical protein